ncbi:MAG: putative toxin-antitoxin system toxin component, PIN family [Cyclobacteriaceae bacterium]|nr:putative toxin-antitoxin system toxin component, PIN family [Cyclobacteriaceae bacterium]
MNFILDTNVLISAALFKGSLADKSFDKVRELGTLITSDPVYLELKEVINVSRCRDPKDDMFLELALSGEAKAIISSDPDLLALNPFENILIIPPQEFLEQF